MKNRFSSCRLVTDGGGDRHGGADMHIFCTYCGDVNKTKASEIVEGVYLRLCPFTSMQMGAVSQYFSTRGPEVVQVEMGGVPRRQKG
jgi:hypothetical protein